MKISISTSAITALFLFSLLWGNLLTMTSTRCCLKKVEKFDYSKLKDRYNSKSKLGNILNQHTVHKILFDYLNFSDLNTLRFSSYFFYLKFDSYDKQNIQKEKTFLKFLNTEWQEKGINAQNALIDYIENRANTHVPLPEEKFQYFMLFKYNYSKYKKITNDEVYSEPPADRYIFPKFVKLIVVAEGDPDLKYVLTEGGELIFVDKDSNRIFVEVSCLAPEKLVYESGCTGRGGPYEKAPFTDTEKVRAREILNMDSFATNIRWIERHRCQYGKICFEKAIGEEEFRYVLVPKKPSYWNPRYSMTITNFRKLYV